MHYRLKPDKRDELQEGRTILYLAKICKYSRQYMTDVFNQKVDATRECAVNILKGSAENSLNIAVRINTKGMNNALEYFFEKVE